MAHLLSGAVGVWGGGPSRLIVTGTMAGCRFITVDGSTSRLTPQSERRDSQKSPTLLLDRGFRKFSLRTPGPHESVGTQLV